MIFLSVTRRTKWLDSIRDDKKTIDLSCCVLLQCRSKSELAWSWKPLSHFSSWAFVMSGQVRTHWHAHDPWSELTACHCDRTSGPPPPPLFHLFTAADCGCTLGPTQGGTSEIYSTIRTQVSDPTSMYTSSLFQVPLQPALPSKTAGIQHSEPT